MKAKDQSKSFFFMIFSTLMIGSILVEGFTHYPFLVERFRKLDDNNAEEHTSENIQHCLGLFLEKERFWSFVPLEKIANRPGALLLSNILMSLSAFDSSIDLNIRQNHLISSTDVYFLFSLSKALNNYKSATNLN